MSQKPSVPKGTRDFSPLETSRRNYIFDSIRGVFLAYGYQAIETPAMENLSTLMGKYGEEGDKLLFKVLNSGDFKSKLSPEEFSELPASKLGVKISEKGLRYDLTVPFARYVVQHRNDLSFPFRRFQIQPVWRADRPQKGRYREFYQCDVDVIGSPSLLNELEMVQIIDEVFERLGLKVEVKLNNRKVLAGIAEVIGEPERMTDITVAIDKLEKVGLEKVLDEMAGRGVPAASMEKLRPVLEMEGNRTEKMTFLKDFLAASSTGLKGVEELEILFGYLETAGVKTSVDADLTLARGLNYYTGTIIEVKSAEVAMGSICGGGRYDDLTGIFGLPGVSGVGISFGADRIYDVLLELGRFPGEAETGTRVLFVNFGEKETAYILPVLTELRRAGIPSELYPDAVKMPKQMKHANARKIPFVVLAGESEIRAGTLTLKDMRSGEQDNINKDELVRKLSGS